MQRNETFLFASGCSMQFNWNQIQSVCVFAQRKKRNEKQNRKRFKFNWANNACVSRRISAPWKCLASLTHANRMQTLNANTLHNNNFSRTHMFARIRIEPSLPHAKSMAKMWTMTMKTKARDCAKYLSALILLFSVKKRYIEKKKKEKNRICNHSASNRRNNINGMKEKNTQSDKLWPKTSSRSATPKIPSYCRMWQMFFFFSPVGKNFAKIEFKAQKGKKIITIITGRKCREGNEKR